MSLSDLRRPAAVTVVLAAIIGAGVALLSVRATDTRALYDTIIAERVQRETEVGDLRDRIGALSERLTRMETRRR